MARGSLGRLRSKSGVFGPYVYVPAGAAPGSSCPACVGNLNNLQQGTIVPVHRAGGGGDAEHLWLGDRWKFAPDHRKGHDLTVFALLNFTNGGTTIGELQWAPSIALGAGVDPV
jgi:hypothetical protein